MFNYFGVESMGEIMFRNENCCALPGMLKLGGKYAAEHRRMLLKFVQLQSKNSAKKIFFKLFLIFEKHWEEEILNILEILRLKV